jgi:hypothetical protein
VAPSTIARGLHQAAGSRPGQAGIRQPAEPHSIPPSFGRLHPLGQLRARASTPFGFVAATTLAAHLPNDWFAVLGGAYGRHSQDVKGAR